MNMNRTFLIFAILLVMTALSVAAGAPADLTGTWTGKNVSAGDGFPVERPAPASLTLTQNGSTFPGTFTGGEAKGAKIEGGHISEDG